MARTHATGIEAEPQAETRPASAPAGQTVTLPRHTRLTAVTLADGTDRRNELVHEQTYLLHPVEPLRLSGNLFIAEDVLTGQGRVFIKQAPLPHARATRVEHDLLIERADPGYRATLIDTDAYPWHTLDYTGGAVGRAQALQRWQRGRAGALPVWFITNTWGDRSRDSRINEAFILQEIAAAARLGADLVQIDDGWQRGRTSNSAEAKQAGGVWDGFYAADPSFWTPDPQRFPKGLEPIVDAAHAAGMKLGLWFAPDSSEDFVNWERDAATLLGLHQRYGVASFKLDSIVMRSAAGERRVRQLIERVRGESDGRIVLDLDVTAGTRPGYFGLIEAGPVFVENRYTDWGRYWPHHTLRVLWRLGRWVDPRRLRMEFLNHQRNAERYADDPLAPALYDPAYLFASVMFAQPLGWFECSHLPEEAFAALPGLVAVWREHREAMFDGTILPIGDAPDGTAWTGFLSVSTDQKTGYALVLRETNDRPQATLPLPAGWSVRAADLLHSSPEARIAGGGEALRATLPAPRSYAFARLAFGGA